MCLLLCFDAMYECVHDLFCVLACVCDLHIHKGARLGKAGNVIKQVFVHL
jgi:hypothetical protein